MNIFDNIYPFSAIVGQDDLKLVLLLNAINPRIGGVLIRGEKGTAKSTTVRALAALLPEIRVIRGCQFSCSPDNLIEMCDKCKSNRNNHTIVCRRARVVTLPLNATEDRIVGGIDFNFAIKHGKRELQPGLLAKTHRGILYIDETNLLDDHIVDVILDAASSGKNVVEREGISFSHSSNFILVGTMNPEEGELRPQLLDRFGLCVEVKGEPEPAERILLMERREEFDSDPGAFTKKFIQENKIISRNIINARKILPEIRLPKHLRYFISELCTENNVAGHRADIILEQAAKALAAMEQRSDVTVDDIQKIALFVLSHRRRDSAPPPPPPQPEEQENNNNQEEQDQDTNQDQNQDAKNQENNPEPEKNGDSMKGEDGSEEKDPSDLDPDIKGDEKNHAALEQIFEVGKTFKIKNFSAPKDRTFRRGSGKRSRTRIFQKQGRYIKSTTQNISGDIALDATLRAAAPFQKERKNINGVVVSLTKDDIREKIREKRIGNLLLFLVDASGSMGAKGRMAASKGAVMSLLLDAYQKRDKVAMVSFRKDEAVVNLPPTSSVELAGNLLKEMPVGGRTPFSAGILRGYELLQNYLLKEPSGRPIVIIISDGKANKALGEEKPVTEALSFATKMSADERIRFIIVDTEEKGLVMFGLAKKFAEVTNAEYFKIDDLQANQLVNIIKEKI